MCYSSLLCLRGRETQTFSQLAPEKRNSRNDKYESDYVRNSRTSTDQVIVLTETIQYSALSAEAPS